MRFPKRLKRSRRRNGETNRFFLGRQTGHGATRPAARGRRRLAGRSPIAAYAPLKGAARVFVIRWGRGVVLEQQPEVSAGHRRLRHTMENKGRLFKPRADATLFVELPDALPDH